ncbi:MAG: type II toxin-antitoxin system RelB/DinJ family antitoxin [Ruminococcus sp.]|jgi:DNA-damage-inducible protein J|nr:type II toxin-antitoxin system RelB/DinJ family antitoxin [Ruminococcus sp.]
MSQTIDITFQLDKDIKEQSDVLFNELGMNFGVAVNIFLRQSLRQGKIPFEISDPFYSKENWDELVNRKNDTEQGKNLSHHELIEADDE